MVWSEDQDLKIAERILKATREGTSYREVWNELAAEFKHCTPLECEKRWENHIGERYKMAVQLAKKMNLMAQMKIKPDNLLKVEEKIKEGKANLEKKKPAKSIKKTVEKKKNTKPKKQTTPSNKKEAIDLKQVIRYLESLDENVENDKKIAELENENQKLMKKIKLLEESYAQMEEDYHAMVKILQRAQKMLDAG